MRSIRWKLTLSYFAIAAITLALTGSLLVVTTRFLARQIQDDSLRETATVILPDIQAYLRAEDDPDRISEFIELAEDLGNIDLRFIGPQGEVDARALFLDRSNMGGADGTVARFRGTGSHPGLSRVLDRIADEDVSHILDARTTGAPAGTIRLGVSTDGQASYLEISDRTDLTGRVTRMTTIGFLISAVVTLAASALVGLAVGSGLTKPLTHLTGAVETMAAGDLSARASVKTRDEIGVLAGRFNQMAERLGASIAEIQNERDTLKAFLADASHELRTPLTAMGTFVELLEREPSGDDAVEMLSDIRAQLDRMGATVADLLLLSRLDSGITQLETEPLSPAEIAQSAWDTVSSAHRTQDVRFTLSDTSEPTRIQADRGRLITLLENLYENSLNAMQGGGSVSCTVTTESGECVIRVTDDGSGIAADELPRVFDRFYRSQQNPAAGSGLGLAISKSIVRAHEGSITATSPVGATGHGTEITIRLPLA